MVKWISTDKQSAVPSKQLSPEILVISAVINTGDLSELKACGITDKHFVGFKQQWNWVIQKTAKSGEVPSTDAFRTQFRDFPLNDETNVRLAADMLLETYNKRVGKEILADSADLLSQGHIAEAANLMKKFQPKEVVPAGTSLVSDQSFLDTYYDANSYLSGIEFPWKPVQQATRGIRPGNLIYLSARPGQGKSSLAIDAAAHAVLQGKKVKYFSLEMTEMEMRYKLHARIAYQLTKEHPEFKNITVTTLMERRVERDAYKALLEEIQLQEAWSEFDLHTPRYGMVSPMTVYSGAEEYDLIVVDLVSLMCNDKGSQAISDWRVAAEISNELKQIALSTNTPIFGTVQINRTGATGDEAPAMHQLSQTDSYGQDADVVLTLRNRSNVVTRWSIEKARFGVGNKFCTQFDPDHMHFPVISDDVAEDLIQAAEDAQGSYAH